MYFSKRIQQLVESPDKMFTIHSYIYKYYRSNANMHTSLSVSHFFLVSLYHPDGFYILVTAKKTSQEVAWSILVTDLISKIAERTQKN